MRLILDTHILIWTLADTRALPETARDLLIDPGNEKFVSVASLWEIAIKQRLRRGRGQDLPFDVADVLALIDEAGLRRLSIHADHAVTVGDLPLERHADPFDRMLVARATVEGMRLLTCDAALAAYGEPVLLV